MRDLQCILHNCFENTYHSRCYWNIPNFNQDSKSIYLVLPIKDSFDLPAFALNALKPDIDYLAVNLQDIGADTSYKSLDAATRDILTINFKRNRLIKLPTKAGEPAYYGTYGAIFNKDFVPIVMVLWKMQRKAVSKEDKEDYPYTYEYKFVQPILRVNPIVFINRSNSVERYIINKLLSSAVQNYNIDRPRGLGVFIDDTSQYNIFRLKVEIENFSFFILKKPDVPSISTTNEELLKVVLDNIEETVE